MREDDRSGARKMGEAWRRERPRTALRASSDQPPPPSSLGSSSIQTHPKQNPDPPASGSPHHRRESAQAVPSSFTATSNVVPADRPPAVSTPSGPLFTAWTTRGTTAPYRRHQQLQPAKTAVVFRCSIDMKVHCRGLSSPRFATPARGPPSSPRCGPGLPGRRGREGFFVRALLYLVYNPRGSRWRYSFLFRGVHRVLSLEVERGRTSPSAASPLPEPDGRKGIACSGLDRARHSRALLYLQPDTRSPSWPDTWRSGPPHARSLPLPFGLGLPFSILARRSALSRSGGHHQSSTGSVPVPAPSRHCKPPSPRGPKGRIQVKLRPPVRHRLCGRGASSV